MDQNEDVDQRCEYAKTIGDGLSKMIQSYRGRVEEFLLQDLQPDTQRLEIEEVARVVITPSGVEVYTFDDRVVMISFQSKLNVQRLKWEDDGENKVLREDDDAARRYASKPASQYPSVPAYKKPYVPV